MSARRIAAALRQLADAVEEDIPSQAHDELAVVDVEPGKVSRDGQRGVPTCAGVYFVQWGHDGGAIKIGRTKNICARLKELQTASPIELVLLAYQPGSGREELYYHHCFAHARLRGEWFRPVPELLACIAELRRHTAAVEPATPKQAQPKRKAQPKRVALRANASIEAIDPEVGGG